MGEVYKAHDTRLERFVAIKVLPTAFATDADRLARFEREAKAVAALSHPNILAIFDTGVQGEQAYVVTELLDGETLGERLQTGALPIRKAIEIAVQIARGLAAAHAKGIIHRDLKPANVFVLADGQVKILDFGLAKPIATGSETTAAEVTDPGSVLGTAGYMAPEQVRGQAVDARTDLFAFGAVLYEMLTGQRAFKRDTAAETLTAILKDDPPELTGSRPDLSPALERIVRHCLEKNPAERFQTARDVAFALESLSGSGGSASSTPVDQMRPRGAMRGWWFAGVAATLVIAAALAAAAVASRRSGALPTPPRFTTKRMACTDRAGQTLATEHGSRDSSAPLRSRPTKIVWRVAASPRFATATGFGPCFPTYNRAHHTKPFLVGSASPSAALRAPSNLWNE
jgi:hypothetical protein